MLVRATAPLGAVVDVLAVTVPVPGGKVIEPVIEPAAGSVAVDELVELSVAVATDDPGVGVAWGRLVTELLPQAVMTEMAISPQPMRKGRLSMKILRQNVGKASNRVSCIRRMLFKH